MQNTKLYLLLKSFSPQEIQRFQQYLQSPYFNTDNTIYNLFEIIRPYLHSRNIELPIAENIWQKLNSTKKFNNLQFNKWCSYLYQYAVDFISFHQLKLNSNALSLEYLKLLNERRLPDLFAFHANKVKLSIDKNIDNLEDSFFEKFIFQQQISAYQEIKESRQQQLNTAEVLTSLEDFYVYQKLKYWSAANHYKNLFDQEVVIQWEDFLLDWIKKNENKNIAIEIYRQIILMQTADDTYLHYVWLKTKLISSKKNIDKITQKEIYLFLVNYCISKINESDTNFYVEIFQLYQFAIKHHLLIQKKALSPWDFKNIITVALHLKEIKWAEKFIKTYSINLPIEEKNNAYNYNLAKVFFIQQKYNESLKLLQQVAYTDLFYQLDIKVMQAKTLYELNELETLNDLMVSLKKLIVRKRKLSTHYQTIYRKFIFYLQKLLKIESKNEKQLLIEQLTNDKQVPDKNWLIEKFKLAK